MTLLLCHTDSYLREFEAAIEAIDVEQRAVVLDKTTFYPGGGGQPADRGELLVGDVVFPVNRVKKTGDAVYHFLEAEDLPPVGSRVAGRIDWEYRYQLMRTHTAMHILCGVVWRDYGASVTGGNMEPLKGRMDFEFERLRKEFVQGIEEKVNHEMAAGRPVRVAILPRAEAFEIPDLIRTKINLLPEVIKEVRTVEIVGLDLQADGGTHVADTSEVGPIRIPKYTSKGGSNKRLYVELEA